uniref:Uncharacterized protein n=1 Tax=Arundo donax TaxID=35708 RepID=A0A0A9AD89_ARUDO
MPLKFSLSPVMLDTHSGGELSGGRALPPWVGTRNVDRLPAEMPAA